MTLTGQILASSWLHGASWVLWSSELVERARLPLVMTSSLKPVSVTSSSANKWNSSILYLQKRLPVSEKRGSLHYLYSLTLAPFWSCCILNALLKVNIKNHINVCKTLLLEPMANITRKVLPAVLLEIVRFSWYDSLDRSSPSTTSAVLWGRLVYGSTYLPNFLRISDLVLELRNSPYTDNAGGYVRFSWEKNWCRSPLRLWQATYKLKNK